MSFYKEVASFDIYYNMIEDYGQWRTNQDKYNNIDYKLKRANCPYATNKVIKVIQEVKKNKNVDKEYKEVTKWFHNTFKEE